MSKNQNEEGQIRKPPENPPKKRRLGSTQIKPGTHPGKGGLYGQPKNSVGYTQGKP